MLKPFFLIWSLFGLSREEVPVLQLKPQEEIFGKHFDLQKLPKYSTESNQKRVLVMAHGFFGPKNVDEWRVNTFPGSEHYHSVCPTFGKKITDGLSVCFYSFEEDSEVMLYAVIRNYIAGYTSDLFGYSAGAAAVINVLDMLMNPDKHFETWKKLGFAKILKSEKKSYENQEEEFIDINKINLIKESIGKVILEKPLMNMNDCLNFNRFLENDKKDYCVYIKKYKRMIFRLLGVRRLFEEKNQPISILKKLVKKGKGAEIDMHITLAAYDSVVSNESDEILKKLAKKSGWTIVKVLENHEEIKLTQQLYNNYLESGAIDFRESAVSFNDVEKYMENVCSFDLDKAVEEEIFKKVVKRGESNPKSVFGLVSLSIKGRFRNLDLSLKKFMNKYWKKGVKLYTSTQTVHDNLLCFNVV